MKYKSLHERLIANSVLSTESFYDGTPCWEWIGGRTGGKSQYGKINIYIEGKVVSFRAHRVSQFAFKALPLEFDGLFDMHLCDNPICIAPLHLKRGSQSENELYKRKDVPEVWISVPEEIGD